MAASVCRSCDLVLARRPPFALAAPVAIGFLGLVMEQYLIIREFIMATVLVPALAALLWFSILSGSALTIQILRHVPLA